MSSALNIVVLARISWGKTAVPYWEFPFRFPQRFDGFVMFASDGKGISQHPILRGHDEIPVALVPLGDC